MITQAKNTIHIKIKAVPGSKRTEIVGPLGDRLKIRVAAPPEGGKANKAICGLIAKTLIVKSNQVMVLTGKTSAQKTIEVQGVSVEDAAQRLGIDSQ